MSEANVLLDVFHILFREGWWFAGADAAEASFGNGVVSCSCRECRRVQGVSLQRMHLIDVLGGAKGERVVALRGLVSGGADREERGLGADVGGQGGWLLIS